MAKIELTFILINTITSNLTYTYLASQYFE